MDRAVHVEVAPIDCEPQDLLADGLNSIYCLVNDHVGQLF